MTESGRLRGDEALLAALLRGATLKLAAGEAKMNERTARRRVREKEFRTRLDAGRAEVTTMIAAQLAGGAEVGYGVLIGLAQDTTAPPAIRRNAARDLIALAGELGLGRDMEARLETLEETVAKAGIKP